MDGFCGNDAARGVLIFNKQHMISNAVGLTGTSVFRLFSKLVWEPIVVGKEQQATISPSMTCRITITDDDFKEGVKDKETMNEESTAAGAPTPLQSSTSEAKNQQMENTRKIVSLVSKNLPLQSTVVKSRAAKRAADSKVRKALSSNLPDKHDLICITLNGVKVNHLSLLEHLGNQIRQQDSFPYQVRIDDFLPSKKCQTTLNLVTCRSSSLSFSSAIIGNPGLPLKLR